jgi:hypothetical protein
MEDMKHEYKTFVGEPEGKRLLGRPRPDGGYIKRDFKEIV